MANIQELSIMNFKDKIKEILLSSHCGSVVTNLTSIPEDVGLIPGLSQWVKDQAVVQATETAPIQCDQHRPAAAAPIRPLAWELPYATPAALKKKKKVGKKGSVFWMI